MERLKFIGKRLVYLVIMLFGVATLVFILSKLVPGNPVTANLSQRALSDPEIVAAFEAKYGLDQPIIVQYFLYIKNLLQFDLGTSIRTNNPVLSELARCYPATIELALFAIILAAIFGILFGVISAIKRNSLADQAVRAISVTGVSIPSFWFALLVLYFFYYKLGILPGPGRLSTSFSPPETVTGLYVIDSLIEGDMMKAMDALSHLILPGIVLAAQKGKGKHGFCILEHRLLQAGEHFVQMLFVHAVCSLVFLGVNNVNIGDVFAIVQPAEQAIAAVFPAALYLQFILDIRHGHPKSVGYLLGALCFSSAKIDQILGQNPFRFGAGIVPHRAPCPYELKLHRTER